MAAWAGRCRFLELVNMYNDGTLAAFARLVVTLVVSIAAIAGYALDSGLVFNIVFSAAAICCILWTWWKNNNVTQAAQQAQQYLNDLKGGVEDETRNDADDNGNC